jgi:hypothetical protein
MPGSVEVEKLSDFMRVAEAAYYPAVSPNARRNWVTAGKIAAFRHPVNACRLFNREHPDALLKKVSVASKKSNKA